MTGKSSATTKLLEDIEWMETSGVDHPANLVEGWAVMKSADIQAMSPDELASFLKAEDDRIEKNAKLAQSIAGLDLAEAPSNVRRAQAVLSSYLEEEYGEADADKASSERVTPQMMGVLRRLAQRFGMVKEEGTEETKPAEKSDEEIAKAISAAWPDFVSNVSTIAKSSGDRELKASAIANAVSEFQKSVEHTLAS